MVKEIVFEIFAPSRESSHDICLIWNQLLAEKLEVRRQRKQEAKLPTKALRLRTPVWNHVGPKTSTSHRTPPFSRSTRHTTQPESAGEGEISESSNHSLLHCRHLQANGNFWLLHRLCCCLRISGPVQCVPMLFLFAIMSSKQAFD